MSVAVARADEVIEFWFHTLTPRQWFAKDADLDQRMRDAFSATLSAAASAETWQWRTSARGRLAEILVLDQFSRNIHRDSALAFACDDQALVLAQEAVAQGADRVLDVAWRAFLYMPYMHSESLLIHEEALRLFDQPGLESNLHHEHRHREVLLRFGRYPQRNAALGRRSTPEEEAFLAEPGNRF
ncbi:MULTISPECIES: DUF924 family protein [unclassified Halomonas]|uniref:DUF924 family protein n=1 Tax=unclassified Halomonas TaxID=2609666 RepID=UPI001C973C24|nr:MULTISPECIES: DUF924 family protein [unclassified Halomonas]MBY5927135.1 DUF924 domain-containing protein [Halomonas sp. DP4Y7-2]MBY6234177.1 DUF924 domain-containing protein [Halomonas sp. DP4Y7-1]